MDTSVPEWMKGLPMNIPPIISPRFVSLPDFAQLRLIRVTHISTGYAKRLCRAMDIDEPKRSSPSENQPCRKYY